MKKYNFLKETNLLDFSNPSIKKLIEQNKWNSLGDKEKIQGIYSYVKDEIKFGYNESDLTKASTVIEEGYGQCNTKAILLMALLRAVNIPSRLHGFYIDKSVQRGAIPNVAYVLTPQDLVHSWAEVFYKDEWYVLEGVILDDKYLNTVVKSNKVCDGSLCYFGVAIDDLSHNNVEWDENNTYIQKDAITKDLGIFESPDEFFKQYSQKLNKFKIFIYKNCIRKSMNRKVDRLRGGVSE